MSHYEQRLETDLVAIRDWVWDLGGDVEQALRHAKQALLLRDEDLAYATVLADNPINRKSRACDRMCHAFIARHLPGAGHLREIAASIRVNVALERIGDYAVTISREALHLPEALPDHFISEIDALADDSFQILHDARIAFRDDNAEQAKALMNMAKRIELKMDGIYAGLFSGAVHSRTSLTLFIIFNMLKRVADQAKNICDQTVYAVRGVAKIPKVYNILFLDQPGSTAGIMALALARKNFPTEARFSLGVPGEAPEMDSGLVQFLEEKALAAENLKAASLTALQHDLDEFEVAVALQGRSRDYIGKVPFHTTALHWDLDMEDRDPLNQYRILHEKISALIELLAGEEAV